MRCNINWVKQFVIHELLALFAMPQNFILWNAYVPKLVYVFSIVSRFHSQCNLTWNWSCEIVCFPCTLSYRFLARRKYQIASCHNNWIYHQYVHLGYSCLVRGFKCMILTVCIDNYTIESILNYSQAVSSWCQIFSSP